MISLSELHRVFLQVLGPFHSVPVLLLLRHSNVPLFTVAIDVICPMIFSFRSQFFDIGLGTAILSTAAITLLLVAFSTRTVRSKMLVRLPQFGRFSGFWREIFGQQI